MDILRATEFQIHGHTIRIVKNPDLNEVERSLGISDHSLNEIIIQPITETFDCSPEQIEETLWHEIVHQILDKNDYHKLSANERLVSAFAKSLHQVVKTMKYE